MPPGYRQSEWGTKCSKWQEVETSNQATKEKKRKKGRPDPYPAVRTQKWDFKKFKELKQPTVWKPIMTVIRKE